MKARLRWPRGSSVIVLEDTASVAELLALITKETGLTNFTIRSGFPPRSLELPDDTSAPLSSIGTKLDGEQLIIAAKAGETPQPPQPQSSTTNSNANPSSRSQPLPAPVALDRKPTDIAHDPPELPLASHGATMVLRVMPDDNSCLFRAIGTAVFGSAQDAMGELRSMVAAGIISQPDLYTEAVLQRPPQAYCDWIQHPDSWGGAIEMGILSQALGVEIASVSVQDQRVDRFNEGAERRVVLVYSGIHYDVVALSPSSPPHDRSELPPEVDITVFDAEDDVVLLRAQDLCAELQARGYFTDTAKFDIQCNVCKWRGKGEHGAQQHAMETGHMNFGET